MKFEILLRNFSKSHLAAFLFIILLFPSRSEAQNYKIHSLFMYKFIQYIEWPDKDASGSFVIGVVGNSPMQTELESLAASKKAGNRTIIIKKLSASSSELGSCHIVFISENQSSQLSTVSSKLQGKPTLIVSETSAGAKKGAEINFLIIEDKMKFELNKTAIERQGLKVSGDLIKLSIVVG